MPDHRSRYAVAEDEKQASYTAKQQRDGVCILAFIFAGLFGRQDGNPHPEEGDERDDGDAAGSEEQEGDHEGYEADEDEVVDKVKRCFTYDWAAYHAKFGNTPLHEAVTAMFAEYASLYMRIAGQVGESVPPPLTLKEAEDISEQAKRFILDYVTPILGQLNSTKFHRLLCHVLDAINMHGNLRHGNTASNESMHKEEKVFYARTSKQPGSFTAQLVRQAQGSRVVLERLEKEEVAAGRSPRQSPVDLRSSFDEDADGSSSCSVSGGEPDNADCGGEAACAGGGSSAAVADGNDLRPRTTHHLPHMTVEQLSRRPGLSNLSSVIGLPPEFVLPVPGHVRISAKFNCGRRARQIVRASRSFLGAPWLDSVMYSAGSDSQTAFIGELRALLRLPDADVAVVCEMAPVDAVPGCPLAARGCTRLQWLRRAGEADCALRVVPVKDLRRVVHVVPDFLELRERKGVGAAPAGENDPLEDRLAMRFFLNVFYPWDVAK